MTKARINDLTAPAKEAKSFDAWFFSQSPKNQQKLRDRGVLPYCEMVQSRHVFSVKDEHLQWKIESERADRERKADLEVDAFISREHVSVMLKAFIDALAMSGSMEVRRHVELIRWALSLPGCMSLRQIAKMFGVTGEAMRKRAKNIQRGVNSDAYGLFPHCNSKRDKMRISFIRH
jgi:hypothetical protein